MDGKLKKLIEQNGGYITRKQIKAMPSPCG